MGAGEDRGRDSISELSSLDDPVRRRLYEYVRTRDEPVVREDAATAAGISRTLAAYHLDKPADAGLLVTGYARAAERGRSGAGRPAKRYARTEQELTVSVPPRDYGLLAEAVAADVSGAVREAVAEAARAPGPLLRGSRPPTGYPRAWLRTGRAAVTSDPAEGGETATRDALTSTPWTSPP